MKEIYKKHKTLICRLGFLVIAVVLGILLVRYGNEIYDLFFSNIKGNRNEHNFFYSFLTLLLGLLTLLCLWIFRTYDVREQIETQKEILSRTEENIKISKENIEVARENAEIAKENTEITKKNIGTQDFYSALDMLTNDKLVFQEIAVQRLIKISNTNPEYDETIKLAFIQRMKEPYKEIEKAELDAGVSKCQEIEMQIKKEINEEAKDFHNLLAQDAKQKIEKWYRLKRKFAKAKLKTVNAEMEILLFRTIKHRNYARYIFLWLKERYSADKLDLKNLDLRYQDFTPKSNEQIHYFKDKQDNPYELQNVNLTGAIFLNEMGMSLPKAKLWYANLIIYIRSSSSNVNLSEADLLYANLSSINLYEADLTKAGLSKAYLSEANLEKADLREASLFDANLLGTNLRSAKLENADLTAADLCKADLTDADFGSTEGILKNAKERFSGAADESHKKRALEIEIDLMQSGFSTKEKIIFYKLAEAKNLYQIKGIPQKIIQKLRALDKSPHPNLFADLEGEPAE